MKYCTHCGHEVIWRVPTGDERARHICTACDTVFYQNPRIVAGCLPIWEDQVLLCRRAISPQKGLWTLPAGFMENGETTQQAAARETREEAGADVGKLELYTLFDLPHINQVYMFFRAHLLHPDALAGAESLEVRLFHQQEIPWEQLAFPVVGRTLDCFFIDRIAQHFPVRSESVDPIKLR